MDTGGVQETPDALETQAVAIRIPRAPHERTTSNHADEVPGCPGQGPGIPGRPDAGSVVSQVINRGDWPSSAWWTAG